MLTEPWKGFVPAARSGLPPVGALRQHHDRGPRGAAAHTGPLDALTAPCVPPGKTGPSNSFLKNRLPEWFLPLLPLSLAVAQLVIYYLKKSLD